MRHRKWLSQMDVAVPEPKPKEVLWTWIGGIYSTAGYRRLYDKNGKLGPKQYEWWKNRSAGVVLPKGPVLNPGSGLVNSNDYESNDGTPES